MKKRIFKSARGAKEKNNKREGTAKQIASENKKLRKKGCVGVQRKANEPGMYVSGTANGVPISTLIDTGATVTLLSEKVFDILNHDGKVALAQSDLNILSATGTPLNIFGKALIKFKFGKKIIYHTVLASDINVDAILGLDCLQNNKGVINLHDKTLVLGGETHSLKFEGRIGCFRIITSITLSIPSQTEMITTGKVVVPDNEEMETGFGLVEPSCLYLNSDRGILGRTLVKNSSSIPIRLLNPTNKNITIHSGTTVGQMSPVVEIL